MERHRKVFIYKKLVPFYFHIFIYRTRNKHKKFKWRTFNQTAVGWHIALEMWEMFMFLAANDDDDNYDDDDDNYDDDDDDDYDKV